MKPCLAIPIFDHAETIGTVVESLAPFELPCIIVDDGSGEVTRAELEDLEARHAWVEVVRHDRNRGRGAALRTAYRTAAQRGMTHVVQLDADGQHTAADVSKFLAAARARPDALVLGTPVFDDSIPWHRLHGRKLSQVIVWIETRSMAVRDPLCGFRCIPLASTLRVLEEAEGGDRMEFDPELVIRLVRAGVPVANIPTAVQYPEGGVSHFRMVEDNLRIARAYVRLAFAGGPRVCSHDRGPGSTEELEWASASERGARFTLRFVVWLIRRLGAAPLRPLLVPIAAYYTFFAVGARRASQAYLARIDRAHGGSGARPGLRESYRHFYSFAEVILDRLALWSGAYDRFDVVLHGREKMEGHLTSARGAFLVGAHLGNFDMLRIVAREAEIPVNVLIFAANAERINEAFQALDPDCNVRLIEIDPTSARTAFEIRRCVDRGEFVAVLADRSLPGGRHRIVRTSFLGESAEFPEGPFRLSMVMQLPILMTIALRTGPNRYDVFFEEIADGEPVPAERREKAIQERVETYASRLEHYCRRAPLQWFNFHDFWADTDHERG
ncbi:MAG: glycosyltransferase family 2 protein [Deltaproteobacteria bacterium]|nr:glycosyltransferase family 2 protein [Deltaproteobacteria bacterium]